MSETNERSVASAGSVAGKAAAWITIDAFGRILVATKTMEDAQAMRINSADSIAPLNRQPPLTDSERAAVEGAIAFMETRGLWAWPDVLRGLLARML